MDCLWEANDIENQIREVERRMEDEQALEQECHKNKDEKARFQLWEQNAGDSHDGESDRGDEGSASDEVDASKRIQGADDEKYDAEAEATHERDTQGGSGQRESGEGEPEQQYGISHERPLRDGSVGLPLNRIDP